MAYMRIIVPIFHREIKRRVARNFLCKWANAPVQSSLTFVFQTVGQSPSNFAEMELMK